MAAGEKGLGKYAPALIMLGIFLAVGVTLWLALGNLFYLANFSYIGCSLAAGLALMARNSKHARRFVQAAVGLYMLAGSLVFVAALFLAGVPDLEGVMFWAFIWGNAAYYVAGVALAFACRDNRAFCKYVCTVSLLMKPAARYARIRVTCDAEKCVRCGRCKAACPMDVDMLSNSRSRANGTECILCAECLNACPKGELKL